MNPENPRLSDADGPKSGDVVLSDREVLQRVESLLDGLCARGWRPGMADVLDARRLIRAAKERVE